MKLISILLRTFGNTNICTIYIPYIFLLCNSYMFRHCRNLQETYTKMSFKHTAINTKIVISITAKKFYTPISNIDFVLQDGIKFGSRIDIFSQELTVTES